ncbi:MAG: protein-L-isoaspartate(D-aspartate) O-methyltransferase [Actinomycetota bacterium]
MASDRGHERRRQRMVDRDIEGRGITDRRVLAAMREVPRHRFVDRSLQPMAYQDRPLPIGAGQTISQPYIVAAMTEALELEPDDTVLEIGTGSGYAAAVLGLLAGEVWTIERHASLAESAAEVLAELGHDNVHVVHGDGTKGLPERGPFDGIVATASGPRVPRPLVEQLADGGRMILPVGTGHFDDQELVLVRRDGDRITEERREPVRFVDLIGEHAWPESSP